MAISFIPVECPSCGANLKVEDFRESCFCEYCGSKIIMKNDNEYVYRRIDEAKIKEAEISKLIRLKELEIEERELENRRKIKMIAYGIALAFLLVGAIISPIYDIGGPIGILIGINIALFTAVKDKSDSKENTNNEDK